MGAAAGKSFQSDKTKYAAAVLEAVQNYELNHAGEFEQDVYTYQPQLFKRHVHLAAAEAKRLGKDVDSCLAQLTDHDLEKLWSFIEKRRHEPNTNQPQSGSAATTVSLPSHSNTQSMAVEEFVDEDQQNNDETTSLLSYGEDEHGGDNDSELDMIESSTTSLLLHKSLSKDILASSRPLEIIEDIEENEMDDSCTIDRAMKVFPSEQLSPIKVPSEETPRKEKNGIAEALAKIWDLDDVKDGTYSPFTPNRPRLSRNNSDNSDLAGANTPLLQRKNSYKDRSKRIDEGNERLMGLQRQKVMSFTQNAQLEREVEALQKQLEKIEELERSIDSANGKSMLQQSPNQITLNKSMQSSASTIPDSSAKASLQQTGDNSFQTPHRQSNYGYYSQNSQDKHWTPKYSYIYPIDEETNEWNFNNSQIKDSESSSNKFGKPKEKHPKKDFVLIEHKNDQSSEDDGLRFTDKKLVKTSTNESELIEQPRSNRYNNRRKARSGNSSGGDSDDNSSNGSGKHKQTSHGRHKILSGEKLLNIEDKAYGQTPTPKSNGIEKSPAIEPSLHITPSNKRLLEGRKVRNTIGNDANVAVNKISLLNSKLDSASEDDQDKNVQISPFPVQNDLISNPLIRRRHSVDGVVVNDAKINASKKQYLEQIGNEDSNYSENGKSSISVVGKNGFQRKNYRNPSIDSISSKEDKSKIEKKNQQLTSDEMKIAELQQPKSDVHSQIQDNDKNSRQRTKDPARKRRQRAVGVNIIDKHPSEDDIALNKEEFVVNNPWTSDLNYK